MYLITIEKMTSKYNSQEATVIIEEKKADNLKEAKKIKRELKKKHNLINHGGYIVNYSDRKELFTNF